MTEPVGRGRPAGDPRISFDRVRDALDRMGLRTGSSSGANSLMACCPAHDEKTPSLHVTWKVGQRGGYTMLHCFGCAAPAPDLVAALGLPMADLFDEPLPERDRALWRVGKSPERRRAAHRRGRLGRLPAPIVREAAPAEPEPQHSWVEVDRYLYVDLAGAPVQAVVRQECTAEGDRHKQFHQQFCTGPGRWVKTRPPGFSPVLYRAPQVHDAVRAGAVVWLVEGEKDVHTAERLGLVATTNAQGSKSVPDELLDPLAGAVVHVVLDRDAAGYARGVDLHRRLTERGCTVRLKLPIPVAVGADFTDHVDGGGTAENLLDVVVQEVATWHALSAVHAKRKHVQQAVAEVEAHLQLAADDADPTAHRRYARRWAMETQVRQEALRDLVDQVYGHGLQVGTVWAGEAIEAADALLSQATSAARRCHHAAGVAVPRSLQPDAAGAASQAGESAGSGGGAGNDPGVAPAGGADDDRDGHGSRQGLPAFRVFRGQIVQWDPRRSRDDLDEDEAAAKVLLSTVVKVTAREFLEVEADHDVGQVPLMGRAPSTRKPLTPVRQLAAVRLRYPDPVTGEQMEIRIGADQWRDHSWLETLPVADYDHRRSGLDTLKRAILAISDDVVDEVLYRGTGWRVDSEGRWRFVHARGAIGADGHEDTNTALNGRLARYNLPDPTRDAHRLREAFLEHSATMLDRIPARVAAPLLGQVFRSVLGPIGWTVALIGPPGSYKTSIAAKAMNHFGEMWEDKKPGTSMSGNGDTVNALRFKLHQAKDCLYWLDDFAPTKSWLEAQKLLEETARLIHGQEERSRSSRDGLSISDGTGPRVSGLCTSEVMPRPGSGAERLLVLPLARADVHTDLLFPLHRHESRHGRALVMASFLQWLAGDLPGRRDHYLELADQYAAGLREQGESVRQAEALAHTWVGWVAMTDFLVSVGAVDEPERQALLGRVHDALLAAARAAVDEDMPRTTGARVRELLRYALGQGIAYVDDVRTGECPPWPLAGRLGWRRQQLDTDQFGNPTRTRVDRMGQRLGYVLHDPGVRDRGRVLLCESTQLEAVLKSASATQAEQLQIDRGTAMRALLDDGTLLADTSEGRTRFTTKCRLHCEQRTGRMVALHLDAIIGEDLDGDDDQPADPHPAPEGGPAGGAAAPGPGAAGQSGTARGPRAPQSVDAPQQAAVASRTDQEESAMATTTFVSRPCTDLDGVLGWTEPIPPDDTEIAPCVLCGRGCPTIVSGLRIHSLCWERSTSGQRRPQAPAPPASPDTRTTQPARPARKAASAAAKPALTAAPDGGEFRAAAAVVDVDAIWLPTGDVLGLPGQLRHAGDLLRLAQYLRLGTQATKHRTAAGQIWLTDRLASQLGVDVAAIRAARPADRDKVAREVTATAPLVTAAVADGYSFGRGEPALGRWTRVWKGAERSVWVVLPAAMSTDGADTPLLAGDPAPDALVYRVGLLAQALGHPFHMSPATTGLDLARALRGRDSERRMFEPVEPVEPALLNVERDISWSRKPTEQELQHRYVHAYDRSGSYLAGVAGLELGIGAAVHHPDGTEFTPRVPGYWRIELPASGDWRMPDPLDPGGRNAGYTRWVTTPSLEFACEQDFQPRILEAYTWPEKARILDPWYERIRDARDRLDDPDPDWQAARTQLKLIYAATIGMMGSVRLAGKPGYAPERRHHIIAKARTNILRRIAKIGAETDRWPVAVSADTILYTSDEPDPVAAWPGGEQWLGRQLGRYKPEGSALLADHLPHLTGNGYQGHAALGPPGQTG